MRAVLFEKLAISNYKVAEEEDPVNPILDSSGLSRVIDPHDRAVHHPDHRRFDRVNSRNYPGLARTLCPHLNSHCQESSENLHSRRMDPDRCQACVSCSAIPYSKSTLGSWKCEDWPTAHNVLHEHELLRLFPLGRGCFQRA